MNQLSQGVREAYRLDTDDSLTLFAWIKGKLSKERQREAMEINKRHARVCSLLACFARKVEITWKLHVQLVSLGIQILRVITCTLAPHTIKETFTASKLLVLTVLTHLLQRELVNSANSSRMMVQYPRCRYIILIRNRIEYCPHCNLEWTINTCFVHYTSP